MNSIDQLRGYGASIQDRAQPAHFAGRQRELEHILVNATQPNVGNTIIVQGAPGAGKTSLLREAASRFEAAGGRALFYGAPWSHAGESDVMRDIAQAALDIDSGALSATETITRSVRGSLASVGRSTAKAVQTPQADLSRWTAFARQYRDRASTCRPVLVLADESQNFDHDAGVLIQTLHTQPDLPFTLICGGLSDTQHKLRDLGVSRLGANAILHLEALGQDKARESIRHALLRALESCTRPPIRHTAQQVDHWVDALAHASQGWPQHIASYLTGIWRALAAAEHLDLGHESNLQAALAQGGELCRAYYQGRVMASRTDPAVILAAHRALLAGAGGDALVQVCEAIERAVRDLPAVRQSRHHGHHPEGASACYAEMLRAGVIEERDGGERIGVPIPSLTAHLEAVMTERRGDLRD